MRRILKWTGIIAAVPLGVLILAIVYVLIASQLILDRAHAKRPDPIRAENGAAAIARGAHLATVGLCRDCHGRDMTGARFVVPDTAIYARNLTALTASFTDADFDRAIRQGIRPDGKSLLVMPSSAFASLDDDDVASIIAYLRSLPPRGAASPDPRVGLLVRAFLVAGKYQTSADSPVGVGPVDLGPRYAEGRHLARTICAVCHGSDLAGMPPGSFHPTPDLTIAAAYDRADFHTLMRSGKAAGGREVGLMSQTARNNFSAFTDAEVDAIYDYLVARGVALTASQSRPHHR
jgi:cytochrome c553